MPPLRAVESAAGGAVSAREAAADSVQEEAEAGMAADDAVEEDDEEEDDEAGVSVDEAPAVTPTVWSTAALTLAAGTTFEVPLALDTSSRCTYSFGVISGSGPVGFKLVGLSGESLVLQYLSQGDGECEVAVPPAAGGGGVLIASIDNTAATFSAVEVRCRVCLESRAELTAREAYEGRRALRGLLVRKKAALGEEKRKHMQLGNEAKDMQKRLAALQEQMVDLEGRMKIRMQQMEQSAETADIMADEVREIRGRIRRSL